MKTCLLMLTLAALLAAATGAAYAQIPDEFTNLQILPEETTKRELIDIMRGFAGDLGVRCNHCHVGPDNLEGMDFATDDKPTKKTARAMLRMVDTINGDHLSKIDTGRDARVEVACRTCHRGLAVPLPIDQVVAREIESDGLAAALESYRALRTEHYGSAAYDFSPAPLNALAERMAGSEKLDEALALMKMNVEFHPEDPYARMLLGGVHQARGEKAPAIEAFKKALEIDPENPWARRQLAALEASDAGKP